MADKINYTKDYFQSNITTNTYGTATVIASHHTLTVVNNRVTPMDSMVLKKPSFIGTKTQ
jgi:hypothetical protein